jgi:hypothetical protein
MIATFVLNTGSLIVIVCRSQSPALGLGVAGLQ